ncbi:MAG TPA: 16S rRNA (guanine(966)-N(2))-methyltransferase RsmD, partial [Woeseiaceae bacterium]|nr:16S rRNA (guanine(966)-N(2))-methyltransferase RsmD [Woeseiaceae bacterium]
MRRRTPTSPNSRTAPPGRVRIVAGKWRRRFLQVADLPELRPTPERIRETLFNWLAPCIEGSRCLDLFAGTGVLGLEALSRGAAEVVFVERDAVALLALRKSMGDLMGDPIVDPGAGSSVTVHAGDALEFLLRAEPLAVDIAFLDPPYADDSLEAVCGLLDERAWLAPAASVYLEQDSRRHTPSFPPGW